MADLFREAVARYADRPFEVVINDAADRLLVTLDDPATLPTTSAELARAARDAGAQPDLTRAVRVKWALVAVDTAAPGPYATGGRDGSLLAAGELTLPAAQKDRSGVGADLLWLGALGVVMVGSVAAVTAAAVAGFNLTKKAIG